MTTANTVGLADRPKQHYAKVDFDTDRVFPFDRFEAASAFFDGVCTLTPVGDPAVPYRVRNESWRINDYVANRATHGPTHIAVTNAAVSDRLCTLRFFSRGRYVNIDDQTARSLNNTTLSSGESIDGITLEGFSFVSLEVPADLDGLGVLRDGAFRATPANSAHGRVMRHMLNEVFEGLDGLRGPDMLSERIAALFAIAAFGPTSIKDTNRAIYLRSRAKAMAAYLDDHIDDPDLGPATLSRVFGASRSAVFRAFEEVGGVAQSLAARRMARAFRTLSMATPYRGLVSHTAMKAGYADQAHFARMFRRHIGCQPSEVIGIAQKVACRRLGIGRPTNSQTRVDHEALSLVYRQLQQFCPRIKIHNQPMTSAASEMADRNTPGHRSYRVATRRHYFSRPNMMRLEGDERGCHWGVERMWGYQRFLI